jgi:hypothetical protein
MKTSYRYINLDTEQSSHFFCQRDGWSRMQTTNCVVTRIQNHHHKLSTIYRYLSYTRTSLSYKAFEFERRTIIVQTNFEQPVQTDQQPTQIKMQMPAFMCVPGTHLL